MVLHGVLWNELTYLSGNCLFMLTKAHKAAPSTNERTHGNMNCSCPGVSNFPLTLFFCQSHSTLSTPNHNLLNHPAASVMQMSFAWPQTFAHKPTEVPLNQSPTFYLSDNEVQIEPICWSLWCMGMPCGFVTLRTSNIQRSHSPLGSGKPLTTYECETHAYMMVVFIAIAIAVVRLHTHRSSLDYYQLWKFNDKTFGLQGFHRALAVALETRSYGSRSERVVPGQARPGRISLSLADGLCSRAHSRKLR